jgi:hypothetical protein
VWLAAQLAAFASLTALKQVRRISPRSALRAQPHALRFSAPRKARRSLPGRAFAATLVAYAENT